MKGHFNASDAGPNDPIFDDPMESVIDDIVAERNRQKALAHGGNTDDFDKTNTRNDWVAYATAYLGRASDKVFRNQREKCDFRENLVKAATVIVAAIEAYDLKYACRETSLVETKSP